MREIISIHVGQCGTQLGAAYWSALCGEHGLGLDGRLEEDTVNKNDQKSQDQSDEIQQGVNICFREAENSKFIARAVYVDTNRGTSESILAGPSGRLFQPDNLIRNDSSSGGLWAKAFYTEGAELCDFAIEAIRREVERCDCLQGFQLMHSVGGGTGSGTTCAIMSKIREEYPDRMLIDFPVLQSKRVSDAVVEPYNAIMTLHYLIENSDQVICIDNEALLNISSRVLSKSSPGYSDLNRFAIPSMTSLTSSMRFPSYLNSDIRKLATALTPFPRLHFFIPSEAPLVDPELLKYSPIQPSFPELVQSLLDPQSSLVDCNPFSGRLLAAAAIFRGTEASLFEAYNVLAKHKEASPGSYAQFISDHYQYVFSSKASRPLSASATLISNSSAIIYPLNRICAEFDALFARRAFFHWYTFEGMDEIEFREARANVGDLVTEYQIYGSEDVEEAAGQL